MQLRNSLFIFNWIIFCQLSLDPNLADLKEDCQLCYTSFLAASDFLSIKSTLKSCSKIQVLENPQKYHYFQNCNQNYGM